MMLIVPENQPETIASAALPVQTTMNSKQTEMPLQKQQSAEESGLLVPRHRFVPRVPVSFRSWIDTPRSSSSILSSLALFTEGSESYDAFSCHSRLTESNNTTNQLKMDTNSTTWKQNSMRSEQIRANSSTKKRPAKKAVIDSADKHGDYFVAHCEPLSSVTTRPTKKVRKSLNNDSITEAPIFTTNQSSSSTSGASVRSVTPSLQQGLMLLAFEEDEAHLTPLHVFVRKQIEVFTATAAELSVPAPGRKQPIRLNQIGLRCIHCRHLSTNSTTLKATKVKRAVCYPSAIDKIYHSVSDMKFDHFSHCKEIPPDVRKTFEILKTESKRSNSKKDKKPKNSTSKKGQHFSSTAQYYRYAASRMGLSDNPGGIIYVSPNHAQFSQGPTISPKTGNAALPTPICVPPQPLQSVSTNSNSLEYQQLQEHEHVRKHPIHQQDPPVANSVGSGSTPFSLIDIPCLLTANNNNNNIATESDLKNLAAVMNSGILQSLLMNAIVAGANAQKSIDAAASKTAANHQHQQNRHNGSSQQHDQSLSYHHQGNSPSCFATQATNPETYSTPQKITLPLASPEDATVLNPLHCFVRRHVELFEADEEDISAPAPGRKTRVTLGQVGIRCVHCAKQPIVTFKDRIKRAVCYPPSIDGIYHSISNMKFDHFGICPHLPSEAHLELAALKNSRTSGRRQQSTGSNKSNGKRNSGSSNTNMAQFYRDSAIAKGLMNTDKGIRFGNPKESSEKNKQTTFNASTTSIGTDEMKVPATALPVRDTPLQVPTGMSALMIAAASHAARI